jgi:hypothetical protein
MAINPRLWKPSFKGTFPFFEAKLKNGAIASVAQMTGTADRTTLATSTASATDLAEYVMALVQDLQSRGIIQ